MAQRQKGFEDGLTGPVQNQTKESRGLLLGYYSLEFTELGYYWAS